MPGAILGSIQERAYRHRAYIQERDQTVNRLISWGQGMINATKKIKYFL